MVEVEVVSPSPTTYKRIFVVTQAGRIISAAETIPVSPINTQEFYAGLDQIKKGLSEKYPDAEITEGMANSVSELLHAYPEIIQDSRLRAQASKPK